jgi:hypothetical protein
MKLRTGQQRASTHMHSDSLSPSTESKYPAAQGKPLGITLMKITVNKYRMVVAFESAMAYFKIDAIEIGWRNIAVSAT